LKIGLLKRGDLQKALDLIWRVFLEFEAKEYSKEGVNTFWEYIQYDVILKLISTEKLRIYACYEGEEPVGILATKGTHISLFFIDREHQGRGIGKSLFQLYLQESKRDKAVGCITVNSSPYAVPIYERLGFSRTGEAQTINGIRFTPMRYSLKVSS